MKIQKEKNLSHSKLGDFFHYLENPKNIRLYESVLRRYLDVSMKDSLDIIELLVSMDIIEPVYRLKLQDRFIEGEYNDLKDIPSTIFDDERYEDIKIDFSRNVFVYFKVIRDE